MPLTALWERLTLLAAAGALGTLARVGTYLALAKFGSSQFPLATLGVNVAGSLAFGLVWPLAEQGGRLSVESRSIILAGFMGAFTTFSTFAFDTGQYLQRGEYFGAGLNILANNVLGIGAFLLGAWITGGRPVP